MAQATWGAINGYVTDPSGAAVPGANVKAREVTTGIETTATADSQGVSKFTHLTPGNYTVTVEAQGFKGFAQENIVLRVDSAVRIDAKLQMGSVSQEVTVTDAPPLLQDGKNRRLHKY